MQALSDVEVKSCPNYSKSCPKVGKQFFTFKVMFSIAQKVILHLVYFCKKICHEELSNIAQSDHTGYN